MYNPYNILGVSSLNSKDEIKKKFRELSRMYHPDNPKTGDSEKFREIEKAWRVIEENHIDNKDSHHAMWRHKTLFKVHKVKEV